MIFFSDLDRTLIYSNKFIKGETDYICIETLNDEEISYMSPKSIDKLKDILQTKIFIPTTTRSIEQYKRIKFDDHKINFEWSIVTNGGNILRNGEIFEPWNEVLKERLKECESLEVVSKYFSDNFSNVKGITKIREVDSTFFYIVVDKEIYDENLIDDFKKYLIESNWSLYVNGRKIYFIPSVVTKENAIKYLTEYLNEDSFGALGDSIMDFNMIKAAKKGFIPADSYLANYECSQDIFISDNSGFNGIEEILDKIYLTS